MEMLLAGDDPALALLRQQLDQSFVSDREFTGVGFFTTFGIFQAQLRIEPPRRIVIDDVAADVDGLSHGAGFLLFVKDGLLALLECYIYDHAIPEHAQFTRLYYTKIDAGGHSHT